jgi:hypothetical protein
MQQCIGATRPRQVQPDVVVSAAGCRIDEHLGQWPCRRVGRLTVREWVICVLMRILESPHGYCRCS